MIKILEIKNFKSIKQLELDCKRVNVFIGEPNTGKSNILEALGFFSFAYYSRYGYKLKDFVRHEKLIDLFYDGDVAEVIELKTDTESATIRHINGCLVGEILDAAERNRLALLQGNLNELTSGIYDEKLSRFKFYKFAVRETFNSPQSGSLLPPSGENLCSLLSARKEGKELRSIAGKLFSAGGLKLGLRPHENKLELRKEIDDIAITYPYSLTSETLQRLVFYLAAILSNNDSVLAFEEPEAHAFPYYTKYLAEVIALDENKNQYFISTHNPYFLEPVLEKTPKDEIGIFITYFKDYQTRVKALSQQEIEKALETDIFLNLERFIEE